MKPIDYSQTIMYKLVPKDLNSDLIYVGHTTNFTIRKNSHKSDCSNINSRRYNFTVYKMIRENGGWNEWQMIQIEVYSCQNKREAEKRERELMEEFNANLNTINSFRSKYDIKESQNKSYIKNKDVYVIKKKNWYDKNKNTILKQKKEYREKNKDVIRAKKKEWYEKNKDAILAKQKEKRDQKKLSLDIV